MKKLFYFIAVIAAACAVTSCMSDDFQLEGFLPEMDGSYTGIPGEGDRFDELKENDFVRTTDQNVSTFSVDADGASYAYMRRCLRSGMLPSQYSVRIEEYLNYFTFNYPEPAGDHTVGINAEVGRCPWNEDHRLIRLGLKGRSMKASQMPDANFVFLIDISGSMSPVDKLPLLKKSLLVLVDKLRPTDRVSIVTYSGEVKLLLESTPVKDADKIRKAVSKLTASGSTAGGEAMKMAYEEALANFIEGGNNRVIMGTDGDFNVGVTSTEALMEMVQDFASKGVYLTICGFGSGNLNDSMLETVSNNGNGTYEYIDSEDEMTKVFVNERSKFYSVANDTKVQVTFDSTKVYSYRLIGYENRALSEDDFENDDKDAGEIGAGQTVTALYEIVPAEGFSEGGTLAVFDVRYKKALGEESIPLSMEVMYEDTLDEVPTELDFAAGVAAYGMILRDSKYKGTATYEMAFDLVGTGLGYDPYGYRLQLQTMIAAAQDIKVK